MKDYDANLENRQGRDTSQPNGVSEDPRNQGWGHRSEMEEVDHEKRQSVSQRVNERRAGETVPFKKKDHGKCGGDASNDNDDDLVDEGKSIKQKYADRYGN